MRSGKYSVVLLVDWTVGTMVVTSVDWMAGSWVDEKVDSMGIRTVEGLDCSMVCSME